MTVSGQSTTSYTYDADGELAKLTQGPASTGYSYNAGGELTQTTLPNGVTETNTFDAAADLTGTSDATSGTSIGSAQYSYDADGRIRTATGSLATGSLPTAVSSETYNADDELTAFNGTKLSYDSNGSLTSDGSNSYTWNPLNELASVTTPSATSSYTYSPGGQQASVTSGAATTTGLYDGGTLVQQSSGGKAVANYLSTGPGGLVQIQNSAGTTAPLVGQVGSTMALTNSAGKLATSYSYDPSGNTTATGTANPNPEQFAASQAGAAGLDLMGARYYDPAIGRFISQDPLGLASGSVNSYEYAGDDPVNANDPSGLCGGTCQWWTNVGAGALNTATFNLFHISPPYCGPGLGFAYGLGSVVGGLALLAVGGAGAVLLRGIGAALELTEAAEATVDLLAEEAGGGVAPRFIVNGAGDVLDTSQITIPEGKFGYLLQGASKSGVFSESMGFDQATLDSALRNQLVQNFGDAASEGAMYNGEGAQIGVKLSVTSPLTGPSGAVWDIKSVWGIDFNGTIRLISAMPG